MNEGVVIITGGSKGMGKAMAKKIAEAGSNVMITGRTLEALKEAKEEMETCRGEVVYFQMDVREIEHAQAMVRMLKINLVISKL